jgi:hypothetical protein
VEVSVSLRRVLAATETESEGVTVDCDSNIDEFDAILMDC